MSDLLPEPVPMVGAEPVANGSPLGKPGRNLPAKAITKIEFLDGGLLLAITATGEDSLTPQASGSIAEKFVRHARAAKKRQLSMTEFVAALAALREAKTLADRARHARDQAARLLAAIRTTPGGNP